VNLPNVAALVLLVLAVDFLLFGGLFAALPLIKDPVTTFEQGSVVTGIEKPYGYEFLVGEEPGLLSCGLFLFLFVPACFLAGGSLVVWYYGGRPRLRQAEEEATCELSAPNVDAGARWRTFRQRQLLARSLALVLFLFAVFGILWGLVVGLIHGPITEMSKLDSGIEMTSADAVLVMLMCFLLSFNPAALGGGLLWLSRLDRRLAERWRQAGEVVAGAGSREEPTAPGEQPVTPCTAEEKGSRTNSRINLLLETVSLFLLFGSLAVVVVISVALFTIVGVELTEGGRDGLSPFERITYQPSGYLLIFTIYSIPAVIAILAGFGIRRFLVRPEPLPEVRAVTGDGRRGTLT
jgi:hypothetical protein